MRQIKEEKREIFDSSYYPPEPMYVSNCEEQLPTLVNNPVPTLEDSKDTHQGKRDMQHLEDKRD